MKRARLFVQGGRALRSCLLASLVVAFLLNPHAQAKETRVKRPPPAAPPLSIGDNFFCSAVLGSLLYTEDAKDGEIIGTLFDGTDRIAMKVDGGKLHFLTKASFEAGDVGDENPFSVLVNDDERVVAIDHDLVRDVSISTFALNRKTGVAVWSKSRPNGFLDTLNPDNQSYLLSCEPR